MKSGGLSWKTKSKVITKKEKGTFREGGYVYLEDKCKKYALGNFPISAQKLPENIIKTGLAHSPGVPTVNIHYILHNMLLSIMIHCSSASIFKQFVKASTFAV